MFYTNYQIFMIILVDQPNHPQYNILHTEAKFCGIIIRSSNDESTIISTLWKIRKNVQLLY